MKPYQSKALLIHLLFIIFPVLTTVACYAQDNKLRAHALAHENIIIDTHIDLPFHLKNNWFNISKNTKGKQFDLTKAKVGGLNAAFMSIYTGSYLEKKGKSKQVAAKLIELTHQAIKDSNGEVAIATSPSQVIELYKRDKIAFPLGMENASPLEGKIENLNYFYQQGIRYLSFTHTDNNHIADSSGAEQKRWHGLSPFGKKLVKNMNKMGMMIDVSHISDESFWQVLALSKAPVIASHSAARHFTPDLERNLSDDMIKAIAKNGGIIMVNFGSAFLTSQANAYYQTMMPALYKFLAKNKLKFNDQSSKLFYQDYVKDHGEFPLATLDQLLDHFDHIIKLAGIEHVGIGSDYNGIGPTLPVGLEDVSMYATLIEGLLDRGHSEQDVKKIIGLNFLRVWSTIEQLQLY